MTPRPAFLDALADRLGGYVAAAQQEADIADVYAGSGDPDCEAQHQYHREVSLALLVRACCKMSLPAVHLH